MQIRSEVLHKVVNRQTDKQKTTMITYLPEVIDLSFGLWTWAGTKEAQVQSYLPGGTNLPSWEGTLVPPGEYN